LACAARPGAVRAAVMVDPALTLDEPAKRLFAQYVEAITADHDGSWRTAFATDLFLLTDTARREEIIAGIAAVPPAIAAASYLAMPRFDCATALDRVEVPLLAIGTGGNQAELRAHCPAIEIGETVAAGHFKQLEVPDQVNAMIDRFLVINDLDPETLERPRGAT
jgi:pimeloyl-ACP methyl ester carboxylesterase